MLDKIIVKSYNLWVVIFVAIGTVSTAHGLAIICSIVGKAQLLHVFLSRRSGKARLWPHDRHDRSVEWRQISRSYVRLRWKRLEHGEIWQEMANDGLLGCSHCWWRAMLWCRQYGHVLDWQIHCWIWCRRIALRFFNVSGAKCSQSFWILSANCIRTLNSVHQKVEAQWVCVGAVRG